MRRRRILLTGWLFVLGLSSVLPLLALFQGIVHIGPGRALITTPTSKPVISVGGDVVLPNGIRSIVVVLFGDITIRGIASDDLVAVGGRVFLGPKARVHGDVLSILGGIYKSPNSDVRGRLGGAVHPWSGSTNKESRDAKRLLESSFRLGLAAGLALLLAGTCVTVVFPWQVVLISTTLRSSPLKSVGAGVMIVLTFTFLVIPLGLSLAGLPFAILLTAAAALAWLFGMTASAVIVGRLFAKGPASLLWASAAGLVALAVAMAIPFVGPAIVLLTGLVGAGALAVALLGRARPANPMP